MAWFCDFQKLTPRVFSEIFALALFKSCCTLICYLNFASSLFTRCDRSWIKNVRNLARKTTHRCTDTPTLLWREGHGAMHGLPDFKGQWMYKVPVECLRNYRLMLKYLISQKKNCSESFPYLRGVFGKNRTSWKSWMHQLFCDRQLPNRKSWGFPA